MPSTSLVLFVAKLAMFVALAYYVSVRQFPSLRGIAGFFLLVIGAIGCYEGFTLAAQEDSRIRYGTVLAGVVTEKYRTDGRGHSVSTGGYEGPTPGVSGWLITRAFAHRLAYGSFAIRIVDYQFPCGAGNGTCRGRDYVSPELWDRLQVGAAVNVRQADGETTTARLDENPQLKMGIAQIGVGALLVTAAGLTSGRWRANRRKYSRARGVVTAVEPVKYGEETRWKVRFAYFDDRGTAQESVDEVSVPSWKAGDDCVAVYLPESPDLATLEWTHP